MIPRKLYFSTHGSFRQNDFPRVNDVDDAEMVHD
jgi:hypothetical protein